MSTVASVLLAAVAVALLLAAWAPSAASGLDFTELDLASNESLSALYERWCEHYSVRRDPADKARRFAVFAVNARYIHEFNNRGEYESYTLGLNQFGDMADDEIAGDAAAGCYIPQPHPAAEEDYTNSSSSSRNTSSSLAAYARGGGELPTDVDWRMRRNGGRPGCVTDVSDQGRTQCGSCWAFAAVAALEGLHSILTDKLVPLSAQQLLDCSPGAGGCRGGSAAAALDYVKSTQSLLPESEYPYTASEGSCIPNGHAVPLPVAGYARVSPRNDEAALRRAVAESGPLVVGLDGSAPEFARYHGGVYRGPCGARLSHQAALIGYGKDYDGTGLDFWLIKNSWGQRWGEYGYMRLWRDPARKEGPCGILMDALYPTVKH